MTRCLRIGANGVIYDKFKNQESHTDNTYEFFSNKIPIT